MPDMPYMERIGRQFMADFTEVTEGLGRIGLLYSVAKESNVKRADAYLALYLEQNKPPKTMAEWRILRDGMIKRLRG